MSRPTSRLRYSHEKCVKIGFAKILIFAGNYTLFGILPEEPKWMSHWTKELLTAYMYFGDKERVYPGERYLGGGNAAYRAHVFKEVGLFNTDLGRKGDSLMVAEEKDIFDKMRAKAWRPIYLPQMILHHIIPQKKLEQDYFDRLTLQMGKSERQRTLAISKSKYAPPQRRYQMGRNDCAMVLFPAYFATSEG